MRGVKGCFVCGENHRANNRLKRQEVSEVIENLKVRNPKAFLTVEDISFVLNMLDPGDEDDRKQAHDVQWVEDEDDYISWLSMTAAADGKVLLSNNAFIHGNTYEKDLNHAFKVMNDKLKVSHSTTFNGITIDTAANCKSVMCRQQYKPYGK